MAENLQEQIDQKIAKKEPLKATEVADAYSQTVENKRKEFVDKGGKPEEFEKSEKAFLDAAKDVRKRQLEAIGNLRKEYQEARLQIIDKSREERRDQEYKIARDRGWDLTEPEPASGNPAIMNDYEGWGGSGFDNDNKINFGRMSLSGYLSALQFTDPTKIPKVVQDAKDSYDKTTDFPSDHYLSNEAIRNFVGKQYLDQVQSFQLTDLGKSYVATYLKLADEQIKNPADKEAYKKYLLKEKLPQLVSNITKDAQYPKENENKDKIKKSGMELDSFKALNTPAEWQQALQERIQKMYEPFKSTCDTIFSANPDFKFQDASINEMLGKKPDQFSIADVENLSAVIEKARAEIYNVMVSKKTDIAKKAEDYGKTSDTLKARNKSLKFASVTDSDFQKIDVLLSQQTKDLDNVAFVQNTSIEDLGAMWGRLAMIIQGGGLVKSQLEDYDKKIKDTEEKEPGITKFLDEKSYTEKYDEGTKQYRYELSEHAITLQDKKIASTSKNPDVKQFFETKIKPILGKLSPDDPNIAIIQGITEQAEKSSAFSFDHRPSADELQKSYTSTFTPAWEKASKDFDDQVKIPEAPAAILGAGPLGNPDRPAGSSEEYADKWTQGLAVPMPEQYQGYHGGLYIAADNIRLRDESGKLLPFDFAGRSTQGTNDMTLVDPDGTGWKVGDITFIKINYRGNVYYAPADYIALNEPGTQQKGQLPPAPEAKPETKNFIDLSFLPKVNTEYIPALGRMAEFGETPEGISFDIFYNKNAVECKLRKTGKESYVIQFPGREFTYKTLHDAMAAVNNGLIIQTMTFDTVKNQENYKKYENLIDDFKEDITVSPPNGQVYFELDWKGSGRGEGNAQIWVDVMPFGGISYHIRRNNVGLQGENDRFGFAANFDDFMKQIGHVKNWSEHYEDNRDDKKINQTVMNQEWLYANISDPRFFYAQENTIGRPVSFDIFDNEVVQMYLDWGGGASRNTKENPMLNLKVNPNGTLHYILNFEGKGLVKSGDVNTPQQLFQVIGSLKNTPPTSK